MPLDDFTLTLRVHDPKEKDDATLSTSWAVVAVPRADIELPVDDFIAKYLKPALATIKNLKLK